MKKIKKYASVLLLISVFLSMFSINSYCLSTTHSNSKTSYLTSEQLESVIEITLEEATIIANTFIKSMSETQDVSWDDRTFIIETVNMYDENLEKITAYTFVLNKGYIVVSAYSDVETLIPEWSDKLQPVYTNINRKINQKIIYLGNFEYYVDNGSDFVTGIDNVTVNRSKLTNFIEKHRHIDNIPDNFIEVHNLQVQSSRERANPIDDPEENAYEQYNEYFEEILNVGHWDNHVSFFTATNLIYETPRYYGHCVPIAMTILMASYRNKYNPSNNITDISYFRQIISIGLQNGYYSNTGPTNTHGTQPGIAHEYMSDILSHFNMSQNYILTWYPKNEGIGDYSSFLWYMSQEKGIIYLELESNAIYGNHGVVAFGFKRLQGQTTGNYLTYLKLADGNNPGTRYITMGSAMTSYAMVMSFE